MYRKIRRFFIKQKIKRAYAQLEDGFFILETKKLLEMKEFGESQQLSTDDGKAKWIGYVNAINEVIRYGSSNK